MHCDNNAKEKSCSACSLMVVALHVMHDKEDIVKGSMVCSTGPFCWAYVAASRGVDEKALMKLSLNPSAQNSIPMPDLGYRDKGKKGPSAFFRKTYHRFQ